MKVTISIDKADVGSVGGHTQPTQKMLMVVRDRIRKAVNDGDLIDGDITFTGDDIAIITSHRLGLNSRHLHRVVAMEAFMAATEVAKEEGNYGAGQDLLDTAPSGNIRGSGPAVAEIEFELLPEYRRAESFMILAADKCGPGAYSLPLYLACCDPMHNGGLLLNPEAHKGFALEIVDMAAKKDSRIKLFAPEDMWKIAALLSDMDRFGISAIFSRSRPQEQLASVSTFRLHNITGKYIGKDDPIAIVRNQGIFPAPEELVEPWTIGHFVTGGARGSHVMPIMPVGINTPVCGPYCLPIVSCLGYSMDPDGRFAHNRADFFAGSAWDVVRNNVQAKALDLRRQGFFGVAMASEAEKAYTGIADLVTRLLDQFVIAEEDEQVVTAGNGQIDQEAILKAATIGISC